MSVEPDSSVISNQRNSLHAVDKVCKSGIHLGFETKGRYHQKFQTGYKWPHKKTYFPPKNLKKEKSVVFVLITLKFHLGPNQSLTSVMCTKSS